MVKVYELVEDVCKRMNMELDDLFLLAVMEFSYSGQNNYPVDQLAATLYDRYTNREEVPEWMEDWLIDIMIGRYIPKEAA